MIEWWSIVIQRTPVRLPYVGGNGYEWLLLVDSLIMTVMLSSYVYTECLEGSVGEAMLYGKRESLII